VTLTVQQTHNQSSSASNFIFDYIEAAEPTSSITDAQLSVGGFTMTKSVITWTRRIA